MTVSGEAIKKMIEWIPPTLMGKVKKESWRYDIDKTNNKDSQDVLLDIKESAYQEGFLKGEKMGLETGREAVEEQIKKIMLLGKELEEPVKFLTEDIFGFIKHIIVNTSKAIIMKEIQTQENIVEEILKEVMVEIGALSKEVYIHCSSNEEEFFKKYFSENEISKIHIEIDPSISDGGFILKTENSYVNATVEKRMEEIISNYFDKPLLKENQSE